MSFFGAVQIISAISPCVSLSVHALLHEFMAFNQVEDYAQRTGMSLAEAERWLAPNIGYDV